MPLSLLVMTVADEGVLCVQSTAGEPRVRETFIVLHEIGNERDRYAMTVYQDEEPGIITATCSNSFFSPPTKSLGTRLE